MTTISKHASGGAGITIEGLRVGLTGLRELRQARAQIWQQARELAATGSERCAQLISGQLPREAIERFGERPVGRAHNGVAGAVQHERAVGGRLGCELACQSALAGAWLAADQDDSASLTLGPGQQHPQSIELGGATDERQRRGELERAGELVDGTAHRRTIVRSDQS